jgi:hypothetical protein
MMFTRWAVSTILLAGMFPAHAEYPIAGVQPSQRPAGAPVITQAQRPDGWEKMALRGVSEPHIGVDFLRDQGNWYTPFFYPNATGHYDIRGLYQQK